MEAQDRLAVIRVTGSERLCIVVNDGVEFKRMAVGYESTIRSELRRRGLSPDEIDALIEKGRNEPS
jgi:hypothetical protein